MKILITGVAGFIGFHVCNYLLNRGDDVIGIDSINDYYDVDLKRNRLLQLTINKKFKFYHFNLIDQSKLNIVFSENKINRVIHLAAQAGVRYSLENPQAYVESNIVAFTNILEVCRNHKVEHLVYASTSSVYGANTLMPFSEHCSVNHPLQFYAATKKANELMAHSYSHLFDIPTTGLRFFTVYGPWGRPDMALFLFTKSILKNQPIKIFNDGKHTRDFTYIDDIVEGVVRVCDVPAKPNLNWNSNDPDPASSMAPYRIYNIGNNNPIQLSDYIEAIENRLDKKAIREYLPLQPGDVPDTFANVSDLERDFGFKPSTSVKIGIRNFVDWYLDYYGNKT